MSALKNLLKSDTPTAQGSQSRSSGLAGQGSHFPKNDSAMEPTTVSGTEPSTAGPSDTSAAPAPVSQAAGTTGPEAGGQSHVGTVSAADAPGSKTEGIKADSGTAAIGETTTYSSRPLASGDPTGSVVDHDSKDPMTYKLPEHTAASDATAGSSGVPSGSAAAAASSAWKSHEESMPGAYPSAGSDNPYKASHLDPRVDGGSASQSADRGIGSGTAAATAGAGAGAAGLAASQAYSKPAASQDTTAAAPSTLSTATDPTDRSAEYSSATDNKGLDAVDTSKTSGEQQGMAGRVLGALGLGGAATAAAAAVGYGKKSEDAGESHDTSAIATQPGQVSQETGPPKHYRRESIPTTAYPAGPKSPQAVAPPLGGAQPVVTDYDRKPSESAAGQTVHDQTTTKEESHTGRNVAAAGLGAGAVGAGAYVLSDHDKKAAAPSSTTETSAISHPSTTADTTALPDRSRDAPIEAVAAAPSRYDGQDAKAAPAASSALEREPETKAEDHTARNTALGAGAGAVAGGAAYAAYDHEKDQKEAARQAAEHEKELARQREQQQKEAAKAEKEHQKELEKQQKAAEKKEKEHQKEMEKEEKKQQKEAEKEEKKHQKEMEKEEKKHQKEQEEEEKQRTAAAAAENDREKARRLAEEEDRKRKEREAAAGVGAAAFTGAGMTAHEKFQQEPSSEEHKEKEKEKKPNIFKRIFKRRKNKETGEDEDYSTDDEEDKAAKGSSVPTHHSDSKGRNVLGSAGDRQSVDHTTGLPYDPSKDPATARELEQHGTSTSTAPGYSKGLEEGTAATAGTAGVAGAAGTSTAHPTGTIAGTTSESTEAPVDPTTGLPYDPSKDPDAARRLSRDPEAGVGSSTGRGTDSAPLGTGAGTGSFGEIGDQNREAHFHYGKS